MTNPARVLAAADAGAGSQVETRTRAQCIPSSASSLLLGRKPKERSIARLRLVDQIENGRGSWPFKHCGSDFVFGFEVIRGEDVYGQLPFGEVDVGPLDFDEFERLVDVAGSEALAESGRIRYAPMTRRLAEALRVARHLRGPRVLGDRPGEPLTQKVVQALVRRTARPANVKPGIHILRHHADSRIMPRAA